jgi:predicted lipid-binding transport protein (Tim44 family)
VITRWQAARGYPKSGFFNKPQHKALLAEIVAVAPTAAREAPVEKPARPARASAGNAAAPPPPQRGPDPGGAAFVGGLMGGVVGGMLRR